MTLQVIKAEDVRDGEPRLWIERPQDHRDAPSSALHTGSRRDVGCQSCEFAIVDRPAPSTATQPPPVLDLDALEGRMRDGFGVHSDDVAHLIADARAAVALRAQVADLAAIRADERARYLRDGARHLAERDHALTALSEAKRLGLEACDAAQMSDDQMMWAPINVTAIRAALEAL